MARLRTRLPLVQLVTTLFVAGCTGSDDAAPRASSTPTLAAGTAIEVYSPFDVGGELADGVTIAATVSGECLGSSVLGRTDALRCFLDNNEVADPCFADQGDPPRVVCARQPGDPKSIEVRLKKTPDYSEEEVGLTDGPPWIVQLADGQTCGAVSGATDVLAGQRLNYACDRGDLYGGVDRTTPMWTVLYRATGSATLAKVAVTKATF